MQPAQETRFPRVQAFTRGQRNEQIFLIKRLLTYISLNCALPSLSDVSRSTVIVAQGQMMYEMEYQEQNAPKAQAVVGR